MTLDYKHKIEVRNIIEGIRELSLDQLDLFYNSIKEIKNYTDIIQNNNSSLYTVSEWFNKIYLI